MPQPSRGLIQGLPLFSEPDDETAFIPAVTGQGTPNATAEEIVAERVGSFSPLLG